MQLDMLNLFSDRQALTAAGSVLSTRYIDLGAPGTKPDGTPAELDPGKAELGSILAQVTDDFAGGTSIQAQLVMSDTADGDSLTGTIEVVQETAPVPAAQLKAGYRFRLDKMPPGITKRYLGLRYVVDGTFTTGTITAGFVVGKSTNRAI